MRLSPDALETIREAAAAQQQDVSAFVLGAAMEHAREVLLRDRVLQLTPRELDQVDTALDANARVVPELAALIAAVQRDAPQHGMQELTSH
ncbi:type II toxin-antitoxin system TacA family antitoxin [Paraoerskovia marina]|nr:DUF1778 domain-containing protein [Paraoerskovia marina]